MKKGVLFFLIFMLVFSMIQPIAFANEITTDIRINSTRFTCDFVYETDAYTLGIKILDKSNKTASVAGFTTWPDKQFNLVIPSKVSDTAGNEYTITTVEYGAFSAKNSGDVCGLYMLSAEFPDTITEIKREAFKYSRGLHAISSNGEKGRLPANIEKVGDSAFFSCTALSGELIIPGTLKTIEQGSFSGCNFSAITINNGVEKINANAFYNSFSVSELRIPSSVKNINLSAFGRMKGLKDIYFEGTEEITFGGTADTKVWKYPEFPKISTYGGCMGGTYCTSGYTNFHAKSMTIYNQLTELMLAPIDAGSVDETEKCKKYFLANNFYYNDPEALVEILTPEAGSKITALPTTVSGTASKGNKVIIKANDLKVTECDVNADGTWQAEVNGIPNGDVTIKAELYNEQNIFVTSTSTKVNIELESAKDEIHSVEVRANNVVRNCDFNYVTSAYTLGMTITDFNKKTVKVAGFTSWPTDEFDLIIPETVTNLNGITYTVTEIEDKAFSTFSSSDDYGTKMLSVTLPNSITKIGAESFRYNRVLSKIISQGAEGNLPQSLEIIGDGAFYSCAKLSGDLVIPGTLKTISNSAFAACDFKTITINAGVERIDYYAFYNNTNVTELVIPETVTTVNLGAFTRMKALGTLKFEQLKSINLSGTADTAVWKYPQYPNILKYGGCMGGTRCSVGYTKFITKCTAVLEQLKEAVIAPISAQDDEETEKCKNYFLENNFILDQTNGAVSISSPLNGSKVNAFPLNIEGTSRDGAKVKIYANGKYMQECTTDLLGNWSASLLNLPDGNITLTAELFNDDGVFQTSADAVLFVNAAENNLFNANIEKKTLQSSVLSFGGVDTYDTLQLGLNRKLIDLKYSFATLTPNSIADANSKSSPAGEVDIPKGENNIDIIFGDSYTGGRNIEDISLVFKTLHEQINDFYEVAFKYSTVADPENFVSFYKWSDKTILQNEYSYLKYTNIKINDLANKLLNVHTIRLSIRWTGEIPLLLSEVDLNDKDDCAVIADKKAQIRETITPSRLFSDNMVIQRNEPIEVWGTGGKEGEKITVSIGDNAAACISENGEWSAVLEPMAAGGPYSLKIVGESSEKLIGNVMIGEVWLASGQSNMAYTVSSLLADAKSSSYVAPYGGDTAAQANEMQSDLDNSFDDKLRLFTVSASSSSVPVDEVLSGSWNLASPTSVADFSSTGYYFARKLREELGEDIPVGIVSAAVSATGIQRWVDGEILNSEKAYEIYKDGWECCHYNAMIYPLKKFNFKGTIWYQGESNADKADLYSDMFPQMIYKWRDIFDNPKMPFLYVNIAPYATNNNEIRESQLKTFATVPNTAMAVITDYGNPTDIHPKYKRPVGDRLALGALALAYGRDVEYSGPIFNKVKAVDNEIVITFTHGDVLKSLDDEPLRGFEISRNGTEFVEADAYIKDNKVHVSSPSVASPAAVRYGWNVDGKKINDPVAATLYNGNGLPAAPFRARVDGFKFVDAKVNGSQVDLEYKNSGYMGSKIIIAAYDGDKLLDSKICDAAFGYNGSKKLAESLSLNGKTNATIKIMAFDNLINIKPIIPKLYIE